MVTKQSELSFIQNKIMDIRYAMFSPDLNPEFCLFNNVIKTLKTDSDGNIWFFTSCTSDCAKNIDGKFFTRLDYYQKGREFRLHIVGESSLAKTDTYADIAEVRNNNSVLIKCTITKAEYIEFSKPQKISFKHKITKLVADLFFSHTYRQFDFSPSS